MDISGRGMARIAAIALSILIGVLGHAAPAGDSSASARASSPVDVQAGLREIAAVAVQRSADRLGQAGGFYRTPKFHIPLPQTLNKAVATLAKNYASSSSVAVEQAINRAAEDAARPAGDYLLNFVPKVVLVDPERMLRGPSDAVTVALRAQTDTAFREAMLPVVRASLAKANAHVALERMRARYEDIANTAFTGFDIEAYTLDSFVNAFFASVSEEEQNIRLRPSARSTETLRKIFSVR